MSATISERSASGRGRTLVTLTLHTVRQQLRGAGVWGVILGLYGAAMVAIYPSLGGQEQIDQLTQAYPQGMLEAFGMQDMGSIEGFLSSQFFIFAPLALSFFTILALGGAIAGAEERGSLDILLGNPVPRWQIVVGNAIATGVSLLWILTLTGTLTYATAILMDVELPPQTILAAVLNLWPICMFFGGISLLCSAIFHRRVLAIALPGILMFGMYLLDVLSRVSGDLEDYGRYSAFYHYGTAITDGLDYASFAGITGLSLVFVALAVVAFSRRDIYT